MRNLPLMVFFASLLTYNVSAQITSVKEYPPQFNESRQLWQQVVENQDSRSIVAMHATFDCPVTIPIHQSGKHVSRIGAIGDYDALGNGVSIFDDHRGIPHGAVTTIHAADPAKCSGGVDAVIFSNGQMEGSSRRVNEYHQRWRGVHEGIIQSLPLLSKVASGEADLVDVEDFLRHRMELISEHPLLINGAFDSKSFFERAVYVQLESLLRDAREVKAGSDSTPHPQARSKEVAEVEAGRTPRKQEGKQAIFLVSKLQEWKTALENGLGSPAAN